MKCAPKGQWPNHWCAAYDWPADKTFSRFEYGDEGSRELAAAWAHKANHFYQIWVQAGFDFSMSYQQSHFDEYVESDRFLAWEEPISIETSTYDKIMQLRQQWPSCQVVLSDDG
eukprot:4947685-Karenia_brevis.AAC.1